MTRELSITYGSFTVGLGTARLITEFVKDADNYETAWVEFEFVTTASTAAAFATEVIAVRDAFRIPRQNLTVTQESQTLLTLSQTANTGFDASPEIVKDGDPADTGRSRHFRVRIEFGRPADNVSTNYRRWSWVKVEYDPARIRTVSISGTYTAGGAVASFAQYRAQIDTYAATVTSGIDSSASWERIGEPEVTRGETDKICDFVAVYREIIFNQKSGTKDDADIVDPQLVITRELEAPGDSAASSVTVGGGSSGGGGTSSPGVGSGPNGTVVAQPPGQSTPGSGGSGGGILRPIHINVSYACTIDYTRTTDLKTKWTGTIRPFIISQVQAYAGVAVMLVEDKPAFGDLYKNRLSATMTFVAILTDVMARKVTAQDSNQVGWVFHAVWDGDPYSVYKYQGERIRLRTITEEIEKRTSETDANKLVDAEVRESGKAQGLVGGAWEMLTRTPKAASIKKGLDGASQFNIASMTIETVFRLIHEKRASTANAGGITGSVVTGR